MEYTKRKCRCLQHPLWNMYIPSYFFDVSNTTCATSSWVGNGVIIIWSMQGELEEFIVNHKNSQPSKDKTKDTMRTTYGCDNKRQDQWRELKYIDGQRQKIESMA